MDINELIVMVQKKNDLNRKRRRFYYLKTNIKATSPEDRQMYEEGYWQAQKAMRAMTASMREARTQIDANFYWDSSGMIEAIKYQGERIEHRDYKRYIDAHYIETILLGDKK